VLALVKNLTDKEEAKLYSLCQEFMSGFLEFYADLCETRSVTKANEINILHIFSKALAMSMELLQVFLQELHEDGIADKPSNPVKLFQKLAALMGNIAIMQADHKEKEN
jgi:hypothetical protein